MQEYKQKYTFMGIAINGVYAEYPNIFSGKIQKHPVHVEMRDRRLRSYLGDLVDGAFVVDKRPCSNKTTFTIKVIHGPLRGSWLPNKTKETFNGQEPCENAENAKSMDYISLDLYCDSWRKFGARIGKRVGEEIHWEDGEKEKILPALERWTAKD